MLTMRETAIRAIIAEPAIFDGSTRALRSAASATLDGAFYIDSDSMDLATLEHPRGYGDRKVWDAWDRIRDAGFIVASNGVSVIIREKRWTR